MCGFTLFASGLQYVISNVGCVCVCVCSYTILTKLIIRVEIDRY